MTLPAATGAGQLKEATVWLRYNVLLRALPTHLAAATVLLTLVGTELVPLLPEAWALRVAAWLTLGLGVVAGITRAVSALTPVPSAARGLVVPENVVLTVEATGPSGRDLGTGVTTPPV